MSLRIVNSVRSPISGGMEPVKLLFAKFMCVTRSPVTVIPYQVETFPVSQLVLLVQLEPLVLLYRATRANESCAGTWASSAGVIAKISNDTIEIIIVLLLLMVGLLM